MDTRKNLQQLRRRNERKKKKVTKKEPSSVLRKYKLTVQASLSSNMVKLRRIHFLIL